MGNCSCIENQYLNHSDYKLIFKSLKETPTPKNFYEKKVTKIKDSLSPIRKTTMISNLKQINLSVSNISNFSNELSFNILQNNSKNETQKKNFTLLKNKNNSSTLIKKIQNGERTPKMCFDNYIPQEMKLTFKENTKNNESNRCASSNMDLRRPILAKLYKYNKRNKVKVE